MLPVGGNDSELTRGPTNFTSVLVVHRELRHYEAFVAMGPRSLREGLVFAVHGVLE